MTCCNTDISPGQYHCARCCVTWGTEALFNQHQVVKYEPVASLRCRKPTALRGVIADQHGVWRTAEDHEAIQRRVSAMKAGRDGRR